MNIWHILFLCFAFQSFFLAILFGLKRGELKTANRIWALFLFLFAFNIVFNVLFWSQINPNLVIALSLSYVLPLSLYGPLFYFYVRALTTDKKINYKALLHFIPTALVLINHGRFYIQSIDAKKQIFIQQDLSNYVFIRSIYIQWGLTFILLFYAFFTYKEFVRSFDKDPEMKTWLKCISLLFAGFGLSWLSYYTLVKLNLFRPEHDYIITLMMVVFIAFTSYFGFNYSEIFHGKPLKKVFPLVKYEKSGLSDEEKERLKTELISIMRTESLYLNNDLKLGDLSEKLDTTRHHISQVLNDKFEVNFFEFINQFRIEEAKNLLASESSASLSVKEIVYQSGFNNKVSFYNAFKKETGLTPSEYREKHALVS